MHSGLAEATPTTGPGLPARAHELQKVNRVELVTADIAEGVEGSLRRLQAQPRQPRQRQPGSAARSLNCRPFR